MSSSTAATTTSSPCRSSLSRIQIAQKKWEEHRSRRLELLSENEDDYVSNDATSSKAKETSFNKEEKVPTAGQSDSSEEEVATIVSSDSDNYCVSLSSSDNDLKQQTETATSDKEKLQQDIKNMTYIFSWHRDLFIEDPIVQNTHAVVKDCNTTLSR